jgi:hypothetical protein
MEKRKTVESITVTLPNGTQVLYHNWNEAVRLNGSQSPRNAEQSRKYLESKGLIIEEVKYKESNGSNESNETSDAPKRQRNLTALEILTFIEKGLKQVDENALREKTQEEERCVRGFDTTKDIQTQLDRINQLRAEIEIIKNPIVTLEAIIIQAGKILTTAYNDRETERNKPQANESETTDDPTQPDPMQPQANESETTETNETQANESEKPKAKKSEN